MNKRFLSVLLVPFLAFVVALLFPNSAAACNCGNECKGTYCWCACDFCSDVWPPKDPCDMTLSFDASPSELSAFKEDIDAWTKMPHFLAVSAAATELYDSVLSQDSLGYIEAREKFLKELSLLPSEAARELRRQKK